MRLCFKLAIVLAAICALGAWVVKFYPLAAPVREGVPADFWNHACHLGNGPLSDFGAYIYPPRDGWFIYYDEGYHNRYFYRVEESVALANFPAVVAAMESLNEADCPAYVYAGIQAWKRADPARSDAHLLLAELQKAWHKRLLEISPESEDHERAIERVFKRVWNRSQRYWLTAVFEFGCLAALIVFLAIPWLKKAGALGWAKYLGFLPLLLALPWYLGYLPRLFASGPNCGGVVYPFIVEPLHGLPWTGWDTFLVEHCPKILEPLSQGAGPSFSVTDTGGFGPIAAIWTGMLLAAAAFIPAFLRHQYRNVKAGRLAVACDETTPAHLAMQTVARIYAWMGAIGMAVYCAFPMVLLYRGWNSPHFDLLEFWCGMVLVAGFVSTFAASLYVSWRLRTRPQGINSCARRVAIILAAVFFPFLTLPCMICIQAMNRHFEAYCCRESGHPDEKGHHQY